MACACPQNHCFKSQNSSNMPFDPFMCSSRPLMCASLWCELRINCYGLNVNSFALHVLCISSQPLFQVQLKPFYIFFNPLTMCSLRPFICPQRYYLCHVALTNRRCFVMSLQPINTSSLLFYIPQFLQTYTQSTFYDFTDRLHALKALFHVTHSLCMNLITLGDVLTAFMTCP